MAASIDGDEMQMLPPSRNRSPAKKSNKGSFVVYLQCYFVTIATILGTGILGLPVTLSHSGLYPFFVSFLGGFLVQALLIFFFTDLLQRAHACQLRTAKDSVESLPLNDIQSEEEVEDLQETHSDSGAVLAGHVIIPRDMMNVKPPNLHLLGQLFLPCFVRQLFNVVLIIHFIAFLISYALAGSEAFAEVIGVSYFYVIPVFVWILAFAIVFALQVIQPIVSILTFGKGSLLLATVVVTFLVGTSIHNEIKNDFVHIGAPFLMGTVALGGVVNVMPFLYGKIQPVATQVKRFRSAIIAGLTTCTVLNVLWCWAVLDIVPQTNGCLIYTHHENNTFHVKTDPEPQRRMVCAHNMSLEQAGANGQISTIPLTRIIHNLYPSYDWVAFLVELFIMISITVSFLTIGAALHHTLSGWVDSMWANDKLSDYTSKIKVSSKCMWLSAQCICRSMLSLLVFGLVFSVAMLNPKGFVSMLEKAASLVLNMECGVFISLMVYRSRTKDNSSLQIPLPMPAWTDFMLALLPIYFGFAIGYDLYLTIHDLVYPRQLEYPIIEEGITRYLNITHTEANVQLTTTSDHVTHVNFSSIT